MNNNPDSQSQILPAGRLVAVPIKLVFLIGMPGAGKTYWGEKVANELDVAFVDLDISVATHENASISALFARYGEDGFREREQMQLKHLIKNTAINTVIACGGGTPCYGNNMELMKAAGTTIYLQSDIPSLLARLGESKEVRPLLNNRGDLGAYLADLLKKREPFYNQAHHILHTEYITVATFAKIISHA